MDSIVKYSPRFLLKLQCSHGLSNFSDLKFIHSLCCWFDFEYFDVDLLRKMPRKCNVYGCKGNYAGHPYTATVSASLTNYPENGKDITHCYPLVWPLCSPQKGKFGWYIKNVTITSFHPSVWPIAQIQHFYIWFIEK